MSAIQAGHPAAAILQTRRDAVRDAILRRASAEGDNTTFARAFAECFIDRVSTALYEGEWTPLLSWFDATYRNHANRHSRALFTGAALAVCETLGPNEQVQRAAEEIAAIVEAVSGCPVEGVRGAVDETDVLLSSLVGELSAIDPATAEQSRAVSAWCGRIAAKMGLTKLETAKVTRGGLVYDIGKITAPHEILHAARALSDDEWSIMREHVVAGEKIVANTGTLRQLTPIVRSHHERYDGLGYPDGLDRERIPLIARIVSVADAFNAMIAFRPYRRQMSPQQAIEELKRCRGTQFDPNIVEAMIDVAEAH
jgi:HD-GYP domain-containing protein (c-di-GMP phosphodiesterase class II)